jgi:hypothetical protein
MFSERLIRLNSSLHPNRTLGSYGTECLDYPAQLPHRRGTPARRAVRPGMHIPRLAREAGLARGCGEEKERINNRPVIVSNCQVPGEPLAPHPGYSFGAAAPQTTHGGRGSKDLHPEGPPHLPHFPSACPHTKANRGRSAVSPATRPVGGPGTTRPRPSHHPHPRAVRDTRRPPYLRPGSL